MDPGACSTQFVKVFPKRVTAPVCAIVFPVIATPVPRETEAYALMTPWNIDVDPRVTEDPIFQKTLQGAAVPIKTTCDDDAVVKVSANLKIQTGPVLF